MFTPHPVSCVTCHVSRVTCHVSPVTCHVSPAICYQRGLPRLVNTHTALQPDAKVYCLEFHCNGVENPPPSVVAEAGTAATVGIVT